MGGPQDPKAFEAATDAAAAGGSGAVNRICEPCQRNFIKIRYEYEDSTGVPGAGYVVQTVTADGTPTGEILAEGKTDQNGDAHVPLPEDYSQVEFYFHDDPEGTEYVDPDAAKPLDEPEPGFFEWLWSNITDAADWVWGVLKGDFEEDPDTSQIIGRMILTMIPGIDQLADVQDIVNVLYRLVWKREWDNPMHWIMLLITLIGLVPVLGSLAKGILKMVLKKVGDLPGLYGVFNFFKKGNAHRWIRDFANDLTGKHLDAAVALLTGMMVRVASYMEKARGWIPWSSWNNTLEDGLVRVGAFQTAAPGKLSEAAADLQKKLLDTLAVAMTRIEKRATRNNAPHTVKQWKVEPPSSTRLWNKKEVAGRDVYQRDDLIDPDRIDPSTGMTNRELMKDGKAPFGADGERINLHHMTQDEPGVMAEVGGQFHSANDRALHMYSNQYDKSWVGPDGIRRPYASAPPSMDRRPFNRWKERYWVERAKDF